MRRKHAAQPCHTSVWILHIKMSGVTLLNTADNLDPNRKLLLIIRELNLCDCGVDSHTKLRLRLLVHALHVHVSLLLAYQVVHGSLLLPLVRTKR